jgi:hypothetical protein
MITVESCSRVILTVDAPVWCHQEHISHDHEISRAVGTDIPAIHNLQDETIIIDHARQGGSFTVMIWICSEKLALTARIVKLQRTVWRRNEHTKGLAQVYRIKA